MSWDEAESESFMVFGLPFKGTAEQARKVICELRRSATYKKWHALDEKAKALRITSDPIHETQKGYGDNTHTAFLVYANSICAELAEAEAAATLHLSDIIDMVTKES